MEAVPKRGEKVMADFRDLFQLSICDVCRAAVADRCHVPSRLHACPDCAEILARRASERRKGGDRGRL